MLKSSNVYAFGVFLLIVSVNGGFLGIQTKSTKSNLTEEPSLSEEQGTPEGNSDGNYKSAASSDITTKSSGDISSTQESSVNVKKGIPEDYQNNNNEDITCPTINAENSLLVVYTNGDKVNSSATFRCNGDAKLIGENSTICMPNGQWSNPRPICENTVTDNSICGPPPDIEEATAPDLNDEEHAIGTEIKYQCNVGYVSRIPGGFKSVCKLDETTRKAEWTKPEVSCSHNVTDNSICGPPPDIEEATAPDLDDEEHAIGIEIKYQCNVGYVSRIPGGFKSVCKFDESTRKAEWTKPEVSCSPRSCGDPGYVTNGRRIGNLFTFPNKIEFECDEGYKLKGLKSRYCQARGEWSGRRLPTCELIHCSEPANPVNGRVSYSSLGYGSELRYECNRGFALKNHVSRVCTADGEWSDEEPDCIEVTCEKPQPPEGGSVQFSDGKSVGSIATYLCGEGTTLVGVSSSKCLENGVWTFDPPKCLRSCIIPEIENGVIGFYKAVQKYQRTYLEFVQFQVGETVKPGESVVLRCLHEFIPVNLTTSRNGDAGNIWCREEVWSKSMQCAPSKCLGEPPPMENGSPVVKRNTNGSTIWYECEKGFEKLESGKVECVYGSWKGYTPICGDSRCFINSLNYPGLILPTKEYLTSGASFDIKCEEGYEKTSFKRRIRCLKGKWEVDSNPCAISDQSKCEDEPPPIQNGRIESFDRKQWSQVQYRCHENFEISKESPVYCNQGKWEGDPPQCQEIGQIHQLEIGSAQQNNLDREKHSSTTEVPSSSSPSVTTDSCYCTYDYPADLVAVYSRNRAVNAKSVIWKGETVSLSCLYRDMNIYWTNGLSFYGSTVNLTCDTCKNWSRNDLPNCRVREPGDSFLTFSNDMKILPGGIIEISRHTNVSFECINLHQGPAWNPNRISGTYVSELRNDGIYRISLQIIHARDSHAQKYDCYAWIGDQVYRVTSLVLKIADIEIQCPLLEENTNRRIFNIQYENNRKVHSVAKYACRSRTQKLLGTSSRECMPNGQWSGSHPSCEDITCPWINTYNSLVVAYTNGNKVNSKATFSCNRNAELIGNISAICMSHGRWSSSQPTCENTYASCDPFEMSENLKVSYDNHLKVGSFATFSCVSPYRLVGNYRTRCLQNGTWNRALPSCEVPKCSIENLSQILPEDVYADLRNVTEDYVPYGTQLQLVCNTGSFLSGSSKTKCGQQEIWEHENFRCIKACVLGETTSRVKVEPLQDRYLFGESITLSCLPGQKLSSKTQRVMCLGTSWSHPIPECVDAP